MDKEKKKRNPLFESNNGPILSSEMSLDGVLQSIRRAVLLLSNRQTPRQLMILPNR